MTDRHEFETVGSRTIFEGAILTLRQDEVTMPGGDVVTREVVEHFGAVAVAALDANGKLVMIHQYRHAVGQRLLELPAGLLDIADEDPLTAAKRELAEETGLGAQTWSVLVDIALSPGFTDEALRIFLAEGLFEVERPDPEGEEADLVLVHKDIDEAVRGTFDGSIVNATAVAGVLALAAARATDATLRAPDAPWPGRPTALHERKARQ